MGPNGERSGSATVPTGPRALSAEDDAKLVFGTVFSLRGMVRKLGGDTDRYVFFFLAFAILWVGKESGAERGAREEE